MNQLDFAACRSTGRWWAIMRAFGLPIGHLEAVNVTWTQSGALRYNPPVSLLPPTVLCLDDCPQKSCPCLILCKWSNAMCACRSLDFFWRCPIKCWQSTNVLSKRQWSKFEELRGSRSNTSISLVMLMFIYNSRLFDHGALSALVAHKYKPHDPQDLSVHSPRRP